VESGKAVGVLTKNGERIMAKSVVANVNPALLPKLLKETPETQELHNFRPGLGTMMIHLALNELPNWIDPEAKNFNYVHIAPYIDDMAITYAQAAAGILPETPALVIGQPTVTDPSRAPEGKHVLWIQVRVLPLEIKGKTWDQVSEEYSDKIISNIEKYAPALKQNILARKVLSPADLERYNPNLIKGDSLGGSHHPAQFFFLRPTPGWIRHRTPVKDLYICGSGTWPGGGVGGGSGLMVSKLLG
jgi:phytoene dehydrogenase-like protein